MHDESQARMTHCPPALPTRPQVLISSGDDGWLHQWDTGAWGSDGSTIKPQHSFDLNAWVVKELKGQIVKVNRYTLPRYPHTRTVP